MNQVEEGVVLELELNESIGHRKILAALAKMIHSFESYAHMEVEFEDRLIVRQP